ncbi:MAG: AraC family transcriptional regulator [Spirochaetes bacterium]|nr:AraC family transcriptional regulator [Spirochaetota bacterium]
MRADKKSRTGDTELSGGDITWKSDSFFRNPAFPFYIQRFGIRPFKPHAHDFIQLVIIEQGTVTHTMYGTTVKLRPGDVIFVPPLMKHTLKCRDGSAVSIVKISFAPSVIHPSLSAHLSFITAAEPEAAFLHPLADMIRANRYRAISSGADFRNVRTLIDGMLDRFTKKDLFHEISIKAYLLQLLALLAAAYQQPVQSPRTHTTMKHSDAIDTAVRFIETHCQDDITLADAAKAASMSSSFFSRSFKSVIGKPFVHYLAEARIAKASAMLAQSERSITDICYESGFNDLNHFCRTFKRLLGVTPSDYRQPQT